MVMSKRNLRKWQRNRTSARTPIFIMKEIQVNIKWKSRHISYIKFLQRAECRFVNFFAISRTWKRQLFSQRTKVKRLDNTPYKLELTEIVLLEEGTGSIISRDGINYRQCFSHSKTRCSIGCVQYVISCFSKMCKVKQVLSLVSKRNKLVAKHQCRQCWYKRFLHLSLLQTLQVRTFSCVPPLVQN